MRVAALYDIHGNLPALIAVLEEVKTAGVDQVVVGGDVIPGPMPRECLETLWSTQLSMKFIRGNGEEAVVASMRGESTGDLPAEVLEVIQWTANQLTPSHAKLLANWPLTLQLQAGSNGPVLFCHATPRSCTENFTVKTPEEKLTSIFRDIEAKLVVCGHTHMQFDKSIGPVRVVNAGSVGMPFGEPGAYWLLIGERVELMHTTYDLPSAARRICVTSYPRVSEFVEKHVLRPPSRESMLNVLEARN